MSQLQTGSEVLLEARSLADKWLAAGVPREEIAKQFAAILGVAGDPPQTVVVPVRFTVTGFGSLPPIETVEESCRQIVDNAMQYAYANGFQHELEDTAHTFAYEVRAPLRPWRVLYLVQSGDSGYELQESPPFWTVEQAEAWAKAHDFTGRNDEGAPYEFDITEDRVYLSGPDGLREMQQAEFGL